MAEANSSSSCSLEIDDEINKCLTQALGIVDLLGNTNDDGAIDQHSMSNASWAAKELIKRAQDLIECCAITKRTEQ